MGDFAGHPFRGNQHAKAAGRGTPERLARAKVLRSQRARTQRVAAQEAAKQARLAREAGVLMSISRLAAKSGQTWSESDKAQIASAMREAGAAAPDLAHLARENKIPANPAPLVDEMGRATRAGVENSQRAQQAGTENTDREGRMIPARLAFDPGKVGVPGKGQPLYSGGHEEAVLARRQERRSLSEERDERRAAGERRNEGYRGTKTPDEEDEVMVKGNVSGAGRRGVVSSISPSGSYMDVTDPKTGKSLGSFHSSNLMVRGETSMKKKVATVRREVARAEREAPRPKRGDLPPWERPDAEKRLKAIYKKQRG